MASELVTVEAYARLATFVVVWIALMAAHHVADYWVQTEWQAVAKIEPGWAGSRACALHVLGVIATSWLFVTIAVTTIGIGARWSLLYSLVVIAVTHYWADRRYTLRWLATLVGKGSYYDDDGAPHLDQAFHHFWIFVAALLAAATT